MDCRNICRELPALLDGDLRPRRAEEVTQHLAGCPGCEAARVEYMALLRTSDEALAYRGASLSFANLRSRMATIEPLEEIIRYQLPKLNIPGTAPRFAVAMVLLACMTSLSYACSQTRQVYVAVKSPFEHQKATLTAALEDGRFPWDEEILGDESEVSEEQA